MSQKVGDTIPVTETTPELSDSSRRAFRFGESARQAWSNTLFFTEHLLIGLLQKAGGAAEGLMAAAEVSDVDAFLSRKVRESDHLGRADYSPSLSLVTIPQEVRELPLSPNMKTTLEIAERFASERNGQVIRARHLLYALLQNKEAVAHEWLKECLQDSPISVPSASGSLEDLDESLGVTAATFSPFRPQPAVHDGVAEEDLLDFDRPARALAQMLLQPTTQPPVVVGVYGEWGSGKSTFMNEVRKWLESRPPVGDENQSLFKRIEGAFSRDASRGEEEPDSPQILCVEYNAWEYADSDRLWTGLIQKIVAQLDEHLTWNERLSLRTKQIVGMYLSPLVAILFLTLLLALLVVLTQRADDALTLFGDVERGEAVSAVLLAVAVVAAGAEFLARQIKQPISDEIGRIIDDMQQQREERATHRVKQALSETVEGSFAAKEPEAGGPVGQPRLKVFVFIDDLDRCQLESIVEILEAIKLFLAEQIFFVLMAVDTRVLAQAIRTRYRREDGGRLAREYIEKIVQVPIQVPAAGETRLAFLLENLMNLQETEEEGEEEGAAEEAPAGEEAVTDGAAEGDEERVVQMELLPDTAAERDALAGLAERYLESNPRRIKRLLNTYRYVKILSHWHGEDTDTEAWQLSMIAWLTFTMRWPHFMKEAIDQAGATESAADEEKPFLPQVDSATADQPSKADLELLPLTRTEMLRYAELANNFLAEIAPTTALPGENGNRTVATSADGVEEKVSEVKAFVGDDDGYLRWLDRHPTGYVINTERSRNPNYMVLHEASCRHIGRENDNVAPGGFTERRYIKICAESADDLRAWARRNGRPDGSFSKRCGVCRPVVVS